MSFEPLGNRVVIEEHEGADKIGSIFVPDNAREKPLQGTAVSVGKAAKTVMPGATVLYGRHSGTNIKLQGKEYIIVNEDDLFAVVA